MIKSIYKLSPTLFSNLLRVVQAQSEPDDQHIISVSIQSETTDKLKAFIENLVKPPTYPISIRAICDKINEHFGKNPVTIRSDGCNGKI